jgi:crotonobetainyl-CoA:carnitine CoA-transferase CaiB-like acyl-CoA transferase
MSTHSSTRPLPLDGIRVIEFTHMVMGPTCGMILADLGAEVIKIEPPSGDKHPQHAGLGIGFFRSFNRNKKSVVLDITTPEGLATAKELIGQSDVMLENFRPGLMAKLGLDYASLSQQFPAPDLRVAQGLSAGALRRSGWRWTKWCR